MDTRNKDKTNIPATILAKSEFDRAIMEVSQEKGYQYRVL